MQLKLNVTETTNDKFRDYCQKRNISLSQGISNLLITVEGLKELSSIQSERILDLETIVRLLKQNQEST